MINRKGVNTTNVIIGLVIALIVMIVLIAIFNDKASFFRTTTNRCDLLGGQCKSYNEALEGTKCNNDGKILSRGCTEIDGTTHKPEEGGKYWYCCYEEN